MIFAALIVIFVVYTISNCCLNQEDAHSQVGHLSPVKLWLFIDEGIFSLLDDLDELDQYDNDFERREVETREEIERRLALEKLDAKPFETVRLDTIDQIRDGFVRGNLNSFRSPSHASLTSRQQSPKGGTNSLGCPVMYQQSSSLFDLAGRSSRRRGPFSPSDVDNDKIDIDASLVAKTEISNPQQAAATNNNAFTIDPLFDYQAMREPETYFMPATSHKRVAKSINQHGQSHIECAICQDKFTRQSMVCQLPCHIKHIFHSECIRPWI